MIIDDHTYELRRENGVVYLYVDNVRMKSHWKPEAINDMRPVYDFKAEIARTIQEMVQDNCQFTISFADASQLVDDLCCVA